MPYFETTTDEFLEAANESLFVKKKSVDDLLKAVEPKMKRKLRTVADCDDQLGIIKNEGAKFNEAVRALSKCKTQFDQGKMTKKDFNQQVRSATSLLKQNCRKLQISLGNVVDDSKAITKDELAAFKAYIEGLRRIVLARKKEIIARDKAAQKKTVSKESAFLFDIDDDYDAAFEGEIDDILKDLDTDKDKSSDDDKNDDDDKDDDKKKKKDDSEDDFDGEDLDDDDDKKKKKKDKDDDDDDEDDDKDDDDDKKKKKKDKDDDDDDENDDKDDDDDEKDAKESLYDSGVTNSVVDMALEMMARYDVDFDAALEGAKSYARIIK